MIPPGMVSLIRDISVTYKLDPSLVAAIIMTESGGNPWAVRYEPAYSYLYFPREIATQAMVSYETMVVLQKTSHGLMQVMGGKAYELGLEHTKTPNTLSQPEIGIGFGCKLLASLFSRYNAEAQVISAYNAGSVRMVNGMFSNQRYVDKVHGYLLELRRLV